VSVLGSGGRLTRGGTLPNASLRSSTKVPGRHAYDSLECFAERGVGAWIDQIVRLGKTVGYGPNGPQGLLARKKVVVITSRGAADDKGTARGAFDFQEPYLLQILAFVGLTDVTFIHAENQGREEADVFFSAAAERISGIVIDQ
jgi:FMN-dependent NADH-azoreductase